MNKLDTVIQRLRLQEKGVRINAPTSTCVTDTTYCLGYALTQLVNKPQEQTISAILALNPPTTVKQLRQVLGTIQFYQQIWEKRTDLLAPLINIVGDCGTTKSTKRNKTKYPPWDWDSIHQESFGAMRKIIARDIVQAYPYFHKKFVIYTDASKKSWYCHHTR